ncbi:MAG: metallophosphoesterase [Verrucomicrobia bacterium]|nr:metallophosphoesterase [Verrucomicrobiota bacterium]
MLALLAAGCATPAGRGGAPAFSFLQINDTHVDADAGKDGYEKANEKARWLIEAAASGRHFARPDFVVGVGDLIHGERVENLAPDLRLLHEMLKPLRVSFYPVVGNHEVVQQEGSAKHEQAYHETFGDDRVNYTFTHGGILFIALNNSGACCVGPAVVKSRNDWLRRELEGAPGVPKIILCHIPLVPLREEAVLAKSFGFRSYMDHDGETLRIVETHANSVIAVLSGHLHLTGVTRRNGIVHVSIAGTASYPCDYALYRVFADRIEARVHQLPARLVTPKTNIHGKPRYPRDFVDAKHPTPWQYVAGRADERTFTIPLANKIPTHTIRKEP